MKYIDCMKKRIENSPEGTAFVISDFTDVMDHETAKKSISRMEAAGMLERVMRGIYIKPQSKAPPDPCIKGPESHPAGAFVPDPGEIASALARSYNWDVAPSGKCALSELGLCSDAPSEWLFVSTGPSRTYRSGNVSISFRHGSGRDINGKSRTTATVIQALRALRKKGISDRDISEIRSRLSRNDRKVLLSEGKQCCIWIFDLIRRICL